MQLKMKFNRRCQRKWLLSAALFSFRKDAENWVGYQEAVTLQVTCFLLFPPIRAGVFHTQPPGRASWCTRNKVLWKVLVAWLQVGQLGKEGDVGLFHQQPPATLPPHLPCSLPRTLF